MEKKLAVGGQAISSVGGASGDGSDRSTSQRLAHAAPTLESAAVGGSASAVTSLSTAGGQLTTIKGKNFGPSSMVEGERFQASFDVPP